MNNIPIPAGILLDFIQNTEAPRGYDTIYANAATRVPLTSMTINQVLAAQRGWTKKNGSSASGGMQIMRATLTDLVKEMRLTGNEKFDRDMQRQMGFHLLKRRGYDAFIAGKLNIRGFGLRLAQEWASFPVLSACKGAHRQLKRGQSYYAGDGVNKALVSPAKIERILTQMLGKGGVSAAVETAKEAVKNTSTTTKVTTGIGGAVVGTGAAIAVGAEDAQSTLDTVAPITDTVSMLGYYGPWIAGGVVGIIVLAAVIIALVKWAKAD